MSNSLCQGRTNSSICHLSDARTDGPGMRVRSLAKVKQRRMLVPTEVGIAAGYAAKSRPLAQTGRRSGTPVPLPGFQKSMPESLCFCRSTPFSTSMTFDITSGSRSSLSRTTGSLSSLLKMSHLPTSGRGSQRIRRQYQGVWRHRQDSRTSPGSHPRRAVAPHLDRTDTAYPTSSELQRVPRTVRPSSLRASRR